MAILDGAGQTRSRVIACILVIATVFGLLFTGAPNTFATEFDKDPDGVNSGKYYFLIGRNNFTSGLDTGLLEVKVEIAEELQGYFDDEEYITYNDLYKLAGSPEQNFRQITTPKRFAKLDDQEWEAVAEWLFSLGAPRDNDGDGFADLDYNEDNIIKIAGEQDSLEKSPNAYNRALAYNSVYVGGSPAEAFSTDAVYAETKGYDKLDNPDGAPVSGKLLDYMLTEDNNVVIPARFNVERDDILITARTQLPHGVGGDVLPGTPDFRPMVWLNITDSDAGGAVQKQSQNPDFYVKCQYCYEDDAEQQVL
jgi:hypothetical protein